MWRPAKIRMRHFYWAVLLYVLTCLSLFWGVQSVPTIRHADDNKDKDSSSPSNVPRETKVVPQPATGNPPATPTERITLPTIQKSKETEINSKDAATGHHNNGDDDSFFLTWCRQVLGIETSLVIETFDYYDFMQVHLQSQDRNDDDEFCDYATDDDDGIPSVHDLPMLPVRGLAASQDIAVNEVVISIPFHAMISVPTTIDHDPVLSQTLGPQARAQHGWDDVYFEVPLLTVALLYHSNLGEASPLHHYLNLLQDSNNSTEMMPFLWSQRKLRQEATEGVRKIARGIQRDIREMYQVVMTVLTEEQPHWFGKPATGELMYSYSRFQWAFAMVNSRHWHLPISNLDLVQVNVDKPLAKRHKEVAPQRSNIVSPSLGEQVPPADQPTEEWLRGQRDEERRELGHVDQPKTARSHSFLAPVADLLNFGPPCTRGHYNAEKQAFELIATCPFKAGQEVTYWYSDDCDDVIIANYGFTHPMVPPCPSVDDWRLHAEAWQRRAELLEVELDTAYREMNEADTELDQLHLLLQKCDCENDDMVERRKQRTEGSRKGQPQLRQEGHEAGIRGSHGGQNGQTDHERNRIRRKWTNKKSDLGL